MKAAFFVGHEKGIDDLFEIAIRTWMEGEFSHVELLFDDGRSASADITSGVRFTKPGSIDWTDTTLWTLVDLDPLYFDQGQALLWYAKHDGAKYDVWGDARFVDGLIKPSNNQFFCSESFMDALGFKDGWRFDPNAAYYVVERFLHAL